MEQFQDPYGILALVAGLQNQEEDEGDELKDSSKFKPKNRFKAKPVIKIPLKPSSDSVSNSK